MCGRVVCGRCERGDRHATLCEAHADVRIVQGWAEVARTVDDVQAEMTAGVLRSAGLDAQVLSQKDHANVVAVGGLAVVRLLVPAFQYRRALAALRDADVVGREGIA